MIIKPPTPIPEQGRFLFLAGSIEMDTAENWQIRAEKLLEGTDWVILNPRRDLWDATLPNTIDNSIFRGQVEWELEGLEHAEKVLVYFDPNTKSPVTLIELGLFARSGKLIVICPDGFWRKGNVDITCKRYGVTQVQTLEEAISMLK